MTIPPEFMAAIIENKADDLPRLVCADWLDDHGESERAEFIRVQCELAQLAPCPSEKMPTHRHGVPQPVHACRRCKLFRRSEELLSSGSHDRPWNWAVWSGLPYLTYVLPTVRQGTVFTRGFVSAIECSWQDWLTHADNILKSTPLERVRLTTFVRSADCIYEPWQSQWPGIEFELPRTNWWDLEMNATYTPDNPLVRAH